MREVRDTRREGLFAVIVNTWNEPGSALIELRLTVFRALGSEKLLTRLVFERDSTDAAGKVADITSSDFVHKVISACVPPVYPPRSGHGWACIPVILSLPKIYTESKVISPTREAQPQFILVLRPLLESRYTLSS